MRLAGPLIVVCAVVAVLISADYWMNAGKIYRGVQVADIEVGGKTPAEAEKLVERRASGALKEIRLTGPQDAVFGADEMGVNFDVGATVEAAYDVGRSGSIFERLAERAEAAYGTVEVSPVVEYRSGVAKQRVEQLAGRLDEKPREAAVNIVGSEVEVVGSREGYKTDVAATLDNIDAAVEDLTGRAQIVGRVLKPRITTSEAEAAGKKAREALSGQLVFTAEGQKWVLSPNDVGAALDVVAKDGNIRVSLNRERMQDRLANVYAALTVEPVEAGYQVDGTRVSVTPGQTGMSIEDKKFLDAIENGIFKGQREYRVPVVKTKPELTTAEAERLKPTQMLASYDTNYLTYDDSPGRVKNLEIASNAVNGTLLAPGEVFSFNALAEPLDYYDTKVIVNGRVDTAEGGGLCQVSSTLYMAANLAGLDVIERQPHYAELPYIRPGFDATVWFGAIDMKFKNNTGSYVLVREWVDQSTGNVYAEIWGRPNGTEVQMSSKKVGQWTDSEGNPVTKWVTYQKVTKNGRVVFDGVLHEDTYNYLKPAEEDAPYNQRPVN